MHVGYWESDGGSEGGLGACLANWSEDAGWSGYLLRAKVSCYSGFKRTVSEASPSAAAMLADYYDLNLVERDPIRRQFARRAVPIAWEFPDLLDGDDTALGDLNRSHGFGSGIELPLVGPPGIEGWFIVLSDQPSWGRRDLHRAMKDAFFIAASLASQLYRQAVSSAMPKLTARERECLQLAAAGKTSIEIGIILDIAPRTVDFHLGNTITKLGCCSRRHAVSAAIGLGLISASGRG